MQIVLASASPRRKELLRDLGLRFRVVAPRVDESRQPREAPRAYVARIALSKHRVVAARFPRAVVVAADTTVVVGSRILGKPGNRPEARAMLRALAGRTHDVLTAVVVGTA